MSWMEQITLRTVCVVVKLLQKKQVIVTLEVLLGLLNLAHPQQSHTATGQVMLATTKPVEVQQLTMKQSLFHSTQQ